MFKNPFSNFFYCVFILFFVFSIPSFAQSPLPSCTGSGTYVDTCAAGNPSLVETAHRNSCGASGGYLSKIQMCGADPARNQFRCYPREQCTCPAGFILNTTINAGNYSTECIPDTGGAVDTPQECGITGFPIWNGSGYDCVEDFDTPCPEGTTNGMYTLPGYDPRPYCADATPPNSSSAGSASSNSGQNSSSNNSDGNGDGEGSGSSSGNTGNSSSASSTGGGGNSSGSASSGQGGSASSASGECDPTAKNYLECLNSKELEIPSEKGSYDDGSGTTTDDRIEELEGELQDVVDQIKSEIDSTVGVNLSGSGTLTDQCYQIMKVQVCFGWARWSQHLALIGNAIIAIAYIASFVIIMRQ